MNAKPPPPALTGRDIKKRKAGYPLTNIIFEDNATAIPKPAR